ncbi:MAG TPA: glycosyl hydrolase family 18 protein [Actinomycetota bacterium]|nr:glycosyl hydrolase family 18 protein [Actinomycetota bacterium]
MSRRLGAAVIATAVAAAVAVGAAPVAAGSASSSPRVSAWLPWWDQARGYDSFVANADLYDQLSPFWYEMKSTTQISPFPGAEDAAIISGVKEKGVALIPAVSNEFDGARVSKMLATASSRTSHVNTLVNLAIGKAYDGLDIDYENLPAADREKFSAFVTELAGALHAAGKVLTVAVHPKTSEPGSWNGPQAQDYAAIGAAADRVRVMAYDYHWSSSEAGAIAPVAWVEQVAAFAVTQIAAAKVQLGMPLYGYDWVGTSGEGVTHELAVSRMQTHGATRQWSSTDAAPWFSYQKDGATHTAWYEDGQSIAAKLPIVDTYGLAGAIFWRLGGEDPAVWTEARARWGGSESSAGDSTAPTAPANATATGGIRMVSLSWGAADDTGGSGVATYRVHRKASLSGSFKVIAQSTTTSYTDKRLKKGKTYWYQVTAVDAAGNESLPSNTASAKVL